MTELKGSKTEKNLLKAFAGESQARNRYDFFAKQAKKEGYEQIAEFFEKTALQEQTHGKLFFNYLEGGEVEITAAYPAGKTGTTEENLEFAANGEREEWTKIYVEFSEIAREEGFTKIANTFKLIAKIEAEHEKRFRKLLQNIKEGKVFKKDETVTWVCRKCGYTYEGKKAFDNCPACNHPTSYFETEQTNY